MAIPKEMLAAHTPAYGPPSSITLATLPVPSPSPTQLLVRVHFTTVNRTDCAYRSGSPYLARLVFGFPSPRLRVLGCEFAGEVVALGDRADGAGFAVGDRVFGYVEDLGGSHAEYLVVEAEKGVAKVPEGVPLDVAVAATEGGHYALTMMRGSGVKPGMQVLVNGGTSGIGSAAVQLCSILGATVTATAPTSHLATVSALGAARVVDYLAEDFAADASTLYDVVIDAVGKSTWAKCKPLLKPGGVYVSSELGPSWENPLLAVTTPWWGGKKVIFPIPMFDGEMMAYFARMMAEGKYKPLVEKRCKLEELVEVSEFVERGEKIGNVVVEVAGR